MNRIDRAIREANVLPVKREWAVEAEALALEILGSGQERSMASARTRAARTVAGRHKTMPGPLTLAMQALGSEAPGGDLGESSPGVSAAGECAWCYGDLETQTFIHNGRLYCSAGCLAENLTAGPRM